MVGKIVLLIFLVIVLSEPAFERTIRITRTGTI